ncbi:MAG: tyrosine-type recombinase/integrase [Acidobacteria bacterium]|nr:tyrosine-type recombinase/integrase [Acidobacteriota bacterium]
MLTEEEKLHLFQTAATKPAWSVAYCAALLTANGSLRPSELRRILWQDVDTTERTILVRRSKSDAGVRVVPLNEEAWAAVCALRVRAKVFRTDASSNYMFHRLWPKVDGTKPMSSWRSAWRSLRKAAGLAGYRFYDLRHQCVTELQEGGVPEGVIRDLVGHVDPAMTRWYSHPRLESKRAAVKVLSV